MFPKKPSTIRQVYLDHAAATPMHPFVFDAMEPYLQEVYANPSTLYASGVQAKNAIEQARKDIASYLHTQKDTIVYTSGGTESCSMAIFGVLRAHASAVSFRPHIITTMVEHSAVKETIRHAADMFGCDVTYIPVNDHGMISLTDLVQALRKETVLVSIMYVQNEIGTVFPIHEIGKAIVSWRKKQQTSYPLFHVDACQAPLYYDVSVEKLHVDLLSMNGSKIHGPKGIGILYKRRGVALEPLLYGGGQERGLRSGTEYVAGIVGMGEAVDWIEEHKASLISDVRTLRDYFWDQLTKEVPHIYLNGPLFDTRSPNNIHCWIQGVEAESLVLYASEYGISLGIGAACMSGSKESSHVLAACGYDAKRMQESIRITLGVYTTKQDIDYALQYLIPLISELRLVAQI